MDHTSWTVRDGVPRGINALAQAPDGTLWVASERGLYTFDGWEWKAAEASADPSGALTKAQIEVLVSPNGTVWFSTGSRGVFQLENGRVRTFNGVEGRQDLQSLRSLQQDSAGTLWALFEDKVPAFLGSDGSWHPAPVPLGEGPHVQSFFVDGAGAQWIVQKNQLYCKGAGEKSFQPTRLHVLGPSSIHASVNGGVWLASAGAEGSRIESTDIALSHVTANRQVSKQFGNLGPVKTWMVARSGELWLVTNTQGLHKLNPWSSPADLASSGLDEFARKDGLVSDRPNILFEDVDGNVWSGGSHGMDRFSRAALQPVLHVQNTSLWSSCLAPDHDVLVAAESASLLRLHNNKQYVVKGVHDVSGLYCDGPSALALDAKGIERIEGNGSVRLPSLPNHSGFWDDYIFSTICQLDDGALYAWATGANEDSLWLYGKDTWHRIGGKERFGRVISMHREGNTRILLGRRNGTIARFDGQNLSEMPVQNGDLKPIIAFSETSVGMVALGYAGIAVQHGDCFRFFRLANKLAGTRVTGLVQSQDGDWWINSAAGITHYRSDEVRTAIVHPGGKLVGEQISRVAETAPLPYAFTNGSAYKDESGRLWFGTMDGVVSLDPGHLPVSPNPRLKIVGLFADGKPEEDGASFGPDLQTLRIQYVGVQLTEPSSVSYRYRLEGHDAAWLDVGSRREAVYTDLNPGSYRFSVMASVEGKAWLAPGRSISFQVRPHLYQTKWFQALFLLALVATVYAMVRLRLDHVSHLYRLQADARAEERIRISRALHDTLLQGLQGLILRFESLRKVIEPSRQAQDAFEGALLRAEQLVVESRTRLIELRTETPDTRQLPSALQSVGDMFWQKGAPEFHVQVHHQTRPLTAGAYLGLYQIAAAAITNAFLHSQARNLQIELHYGRDHFKLRCIDNGVGMPEAVARHGKNGHWGIIGMREQAREMGAQFDLRSAPGVGTSVQVVLIASAAYDAEGMLAN